jgi:ATP-dependent HslUV protease, peptidase subunit HslV
MAGDGQVTLGHEVLKASAKKLRRCITTRSGRIRRLHGRRVRAVSRASNPSWNSSTATSRAPWWNWPRNGAPTACCATWKRCCWWPTASTYIVSGNGDVIEPDEGVAAIGSGGPFALSAATALMRNTKLSARQIAERP